MKIIGGLDTDLSLADITSVVAGTGLTDGGTSGDVTLNVIGGDGITANANDIAITPSQTTITSIYNAALKVGRDADNLIDFATTDNKIYFRANGADQLVLQDGILLPRSTNDIDLGSASLEFKDAYFDGVVTSDSFVGPLTGQADTVATIAGLAPNTATTQATQGNITSLGTLSSLAVTGAGGLGGPSMTLTHQDADKIALDINASNTTANVLDINAQALTSGAAIYIDCNSLSHISTSGALYIDVDESSTGSVQNTLAYIDYDRTGDLTSTNNNHTTGLDISMNDLATGNAEYSTSKLTGIDINLDHANVSGIHRQTGIDISLTDGDPVLGTTITTIGILSNVENGAADIMMQSSVDTGDYCTIATNAAGATTITTVDDDGSQADFEVVADGDITLDANGDIKLEPKSGGSILLDGTIDIDAGVVTGATSITSTAFVGTLSTASQPNITGIGTIGTGVWEGTAIASDQQKHLMHYQVQGYGAATGGNYHISKNIGSNTAPFLHNVSTGSDGLNAKAVTVWMRTGGHVMPNDCTLTRFTGWTESQGSASQTVALFRVRLSDGSDTDPSAVLLQEITYTASGNQIADLFDETTASGGRAAALLDMEAGDIIFSAIKGDGNPIYFNGTFEVEF